MEGEESNYFKTPKFIIRELTNEDLPAFHEMQGDKDVMLYTSGKANTFAEDKADLLKVIKHYTQVNNQFWVWAIERKADRRMVGTCALVGDDKGTFEIGFRFLKKFWRRGYGKEICFALIDYAFCQDEVENIVAYVDARNIASVKILEQSDLGFVKEVVDTKTNTIDRFYKLNIIEGEQYL